MVSPSILIAESEKLENELGKIIKKAYDEATGETNFYVGLSGGSLPGLLVRVLKQLQDIDWKKWLFFFCDERCVPTSSEHSTLGAYLSLLNSQDEKLPISASQFITIDPSLRPDDMAEDYSLKIRQCFNNGSSLPRFHLLLLGLGPDGHTCSLFPNHPLLNENTKWISYLIDSPKPPSERITMTFPVLNNAKYCVFVTTGVSKAHVIKEILEDNKSYPASMVRPHSGELIWLMDKAAASRLKSAL